MTWLPTVLAWVMALVISHRCFMVIYHMELRTRQCSLVQFWCFGLCYGVLMMAALGAAMHITEGIGITGDWLFLIASAGLILSDRRKRRANTFAQLARPSKFLNLK